MNQHAHRDPNQKSASLRYVWLTVIAAVGVILAILVFPDSIDAFASKLNLLSEPEIAINHSEDVRIQTFERDGKRFLFGGKSFDDHFDITDWSLELKQLKYGLGREWFPALIKPEFISLAEADEMFQDKARMLVVKIGSEAHVYPISTIRLNEVVNDRVGGVPVFAAYCFLAELGAIYDRRYGKHELTFAVSGYTYKDPEVWEGRHAFVLWDRDTESLWWPPIGRAVSGPMKGQPMKLLNDSMWGQTNWGKIKQNYPEAVVLKYDIEYSPPETWPRLDAASVGKVASTRPEDQASFDIAPHWGDQDALPGK